ncbi:hypothetical protein P3G55_11975 [Leptospira sp. 96542]|nr:hypothetical protein [Leptospira sp. 96542]
MTGEAPPPPDAPEAPMPTPEMAASPGVEENSDFDFGNLSDKVRDGIQNLLKDFIPDLSLPNLGLPDSILSEIASLLSGEASLTPRSSWSDIPSWVRGLMPFLGFPVSFTNDSRDGDSTGGESNRETKPGEKIIAPESTNPEYVRIRNQVLERFFGIDTDPGKSRDLLKTLVKDNPLLSENEKKHLTDSLEKMYKLAKSDVEKLKTSYLNENQIPNQFKPNASFAPLLPGVANLSMLTPEGKIPAGGREVEIGGVTGIREYDINLDRKDLESRVGEMNDHNIRNPDAHEIDIQVDTEKGVGANTDVRYNIQPRGFDESGNVLWGTYSFHEADNIHQFTDKATAELFVNGAIKWREYQIQTGETKVSPLLINDFSMPGVGNSPYVNPTDKSLNPVGHHHRPSSMDIALPGKDGGSASNTDSKKDPNYDQDKTKALIKIMGESVPSGYKLKVYLQDEDVVTYFSNSNIIVQNIAPHTHHLHFELVKN